MSDSNQAYASAELGSELRGDRPGEFVRTFAGLVDDPDALTLLNYFDSILDQPVQETAIGREILSNVSTETIDRAVRNGAVSQMKAATGLTGHDRDGKDFYIEVCERLEHEGSIGLVFGSPGSGKTATTLDIARVWRARTGGDLVGNFNWDGFARTFTSDRELLEAMASIQGPVLAIIDEIAQELSGFGEGNKPAEVFSDALLFIRKQEREFGPYAKKGSALLVGHTRVKTAKPIRRVASFGIEKPSLTQKDRVRILDSEGGKDTWDDVATFQGLTDTAESYNQYEAARFSIELVDQEEIDEIDPDEIERREAIKTVLRAVVLQEQSQTEAAQLVKYSQSWVSDRLREYEAGEHRELLED